MSNTKSLGCKVDFKEKTIYVTKVFEKLSKIAGSEEYKIFSQVIKDNPDYEIKYNHKKGNGNRHKGLTIDNMRTYIADNKDDEMLKAFDLKINNFKTLYKKVNYGDTKKWFLTQCPEVKSESKK